MEDSNTIQRRTKWWHWPARFLLILIPLEIILPFVPVPGEYEAGIFYANSYRERLYLSELSGRTDYNSEGYRSFQYFFEDVPSNSQTSESSAAFSQLPISIASRT